MGQVWGGGQSIEEIGRRRERRDRLLTRQGEGREASCEDERGEGKEEKENMFYYLLEQHNAK
jgi:hypothetical protein